jgi:NAD-dependent dihydropyrimidine dehydrogenase PreA subunit
MNNASKNLEKKIKELSELHYTAITILEKCRSCGTCVRFCPLKIRKFNEDGKAITINSNRSCGGCSVCFHRCPNNAIELIELKKVK